MHNQMKVTINPKMDGHCFTHDMRPDTAKCLWTKYRIACLDDSSPLRIGSDI